MSRHPFLTAALERTLALVAAGALALSACGGGEIADPEEAATTSEPEQAEAPEEAAEAEDEPVEEAADGEDAAADESADADTADDEAADDVADDASGDDAAVAEGEEACVVDAEMVSSVFEPVFGAPVEYLDSRTDERGGVSCSFQTTGGELFVNFGVSESTWDGSQEEVDELVATLSEFAGEPTERPDLGDEAVLFNADGSDLYSLAVFSGETVYSFGMTGDLDGSADERRQVLVGLYEAAAG